MNVKQFRQEFLATHLCKYNLNSNIYYLNSLNSSTENDLQDVPLEQHSELLFFEKDNFLDPNPVKETMSDEELKSCIPEQCHEFLQVFRQQNSEKLPESTKYNLEIKLLPDTTPPWGPIYKLSEKESSSLKEYLQKNLSRKFIQKSKSPAGAPVLFVSKPNGSIRLCVDYRRLNAITVKNRTPLPLILEIMSQLKGKRYFTKIDLCEAYYLIRIEPGDEWKTAFRTKYGHFEYLVMPFGLTNAPAAFQSLMNDIFRNLLDDFVSIYLDDILIFSDNLEDHIRHVSRVLQ